MERDGAWNRLLKVPKKFAKISMHGLLKIYICSAVKGYV